MTALGVALSTLLGALLAAGASKGAWPQWGGPARSFVTDSPALATSWPASGPRRLWERPLGDGFSAIVTDGTTLYTLYRNGLNDVAVAMDAATGRTVWESGYAAPFKEECSERLGPAPRSAPLLMGDRLITVSAGGLMNSFDRRTGRVAWTRELFDGAAATVRPCGYSASPLAYKNLILTTVGGRGRAATAIDAATGRVVWQAQDFENSYSSPILIDLDGRAELVTFTAGEIAGLDPDTGALEWSHPHPAEFGANVATPVWGDDHLLFVSSAYNGGSRVLKLTRADGRVSVQELWANKRIRIHFGNAVRLGQRVYASSGDAASAPFAAIDVLTGDTIWRDRSVVRASLLSADGKLVILDEDGHLVVATPGNEGLVVHGKTQLLGERSWTPPTLSGTRVYVRDRTRIMALDLGKP